jgi:hypothetical protein
MSLARAAFSATAICLGVSTAYAQQAATSAATSQPPLFQGIMVDAKGKTVGRYVFSGRNNPEGYAEDLFLGAVVIRQISGTWVMLQMGDFKNGFADTDPQAMQFYYQSTDCKSTAYLPVNTRGPNYATAPAIGYVVTIPPATAPSIYFAGSPANVTFGSRLYGGVCNTDSETLYAGPVQIVPLSGLGLTPPFSIK